MIGYPYTYGDYLSGKDAMQRRVDFVDKALVLVVCWSLSAAVSHARGFPSNKVTSIENDQCPATGDRNAPVFAPISAICSCTSPEVKTAILMIGVASICYSAICSKDKPLVAACSALATYAVTTLNK